MRLYNTQALGYVINEFFNPIKNPDYKSAQSRGVTQWSYFRVFLDNMFCWNAHRDVLTYGVTNEDQKLLIKKLLEFSSEINNIAARDTWYMPLFHPNGHMLYQWHFRKSGGSVAGGVDVVPTPTSTDEFRTLYTTNRRVYEASDWSTLTINPSLFEYFISPVFKCMYDYALDHKCFYVSSRNAGLPMGAYRPSELKLLMTERGVRNLEVTIAPDGHLRVSTLEAGETTVPDKFRRLCEHFSYSTDVTQLIPITKDKADGDVPMFGVELELTTSLSVRDVVTAFPDPFLICKQDSSITGAMPNRYELVTTGASLRTHRKMWAHLFHKHDYDKFDTSRQTSNGMHIHVGRDAFAAMCKYDENNNIVVDEFHVRKFSWFFNNPANRHFMLETSEREQREINSYCNFVATETKKSESFRKVVDNARGKMQAVNHSKKPTIEVRLFKGIVSYATIIKNLELVDAAIRYTRDASIQDCTIDRFITWLDKQPRSRYRLLREHINQMDSQCVADTSIVLNALYGVTDKMKAIGVIKKLPIKLTEDIVKNINSVHESWRLYYKDGTISEKKSAGGSMQIHDKVSSRYVRAS